MFWNGLDTSLDGDLAGNLVFFDDNYLAQPPLTPTELSNGTYVKLDHYAVDWYEEYADGAWAAILSERKTTCMWPQATIASEVYIVGNIPAQDMAGSLHVPGSQRGIFTPHLGCHQCILNGQPWFRYSVEINYGSTSGSRRALTQCVAFGGLQWESMRYMASVSEQVTQNGFTGPIGNQTTFSPNPQWYRLNSKFPDLTQIKASGPAYGNSELSGQLSTLGRMTELQNRVESWKAQGLIDVSAQKANRYAAFNGMARPAHPNDLSECCSANDMDYLTEKCCGESGMCGSQCCPDDFECDPETQQCVSNKYYCRPS